MTLTPWLRFLILIASNSRGGLPDPKQPEKESPYRRYAKWATITIFVIVMIPIVLLLTMNEVQK